MFYNVDWFHFSLSIWSTSVDIPYLLIHKRLWQLRFLACNLFDCRNAVSYFYSWSSTSLISMNLNNKQIHWPNNEVRVFCFDIALLCKSTEEKQNIYMKEFSCLRIKILALDEEVLNKPILSNIYRYLEAWFYLQFSTVLLKVSILWTGTSPKWEMLQSGLLDVQIFEDIRV